MRELIHITEKNGQQLVSARELYSYLEYNISQWKRWYIKNIVQDDFFEEGKDYTPLDLMSSSTIDFALTLDMAKELSMLARNEKGKQARQYFIEVEKKARQQTDILKLDPIIAMRMEQVKLEQRVSQLEVNTTTRPSYFTIAGYATLHKIKVGVSLAAKLGAAASRICKSEGWPIDKIPDPRFGQVNSYPQKILEQVFETVSVN